MRLQLLQYLSWIPDRLMIRLQYYIHQGRCLHLKKPQRFTEKIQHYKCYYRNPNMWKCVDKYEVRNYLIERGLEGYLNEIYGVFDSVYDINFDKLPNQFVVKTTDGGGSTEVYICHENNGKIHTEIINRFKHFTGRVIKSPGREYAYYGIKKTRIIVEKYLEDELNLSKSIIDYKFFCFNGIALFCQVISNRETNETIDLFDREFNHQAGLVGLNEKAHNSVHPIAKPLNYDKMIEVAETLSSDFPFVRVDLYNLQGQIIFGEMTFYPASSYGHFTREDFDFHNYKNEFSKIFR